MRFLLLTLSTLMISYSCFAGHNNMHYLASGAFLRRRKMNKKIYIADIDGENLVEYFKSKANYEVVGSSSDGEEVVNSVIKLQPDILVMEVMLSKLDGFAVYEKIKVLKEKTPKVIFISSLSHSGFVTKALQMGASYFMIKPINAENLESRINEILSNNLPQENKQLDEKISNIFISIGIPAHIKGYQFLREAVKLAVEEPEIISSITKKLYPTIAERFETSSSKVERGMRHAIEVAWNRGKIENINNIFGLKIYNRNEKPTNGELIALIADKMLMDG